MKQTIRASSQEGKFFRDKQASFWLKQASLLRLRFDGHFLLDWNHLSLAIGSIAKPYFAAGIEKSS